MAIRRAVRYLKILGRTLGPVIYYEKRLMETMTWGRKSPAWIVKIFPHWVAKVIRNRDISVGVDFLFNLKTENP